MCEGMRVAVSAILCDLRAALVTLELPTGNAAHALVDAAKRQPGSHEYRTEPFSEPVKNRL